MRELTDGRWMWGKAALFGAVAIAASGLLMLERPSWRVGLLLACTVWACCRLYYFGFYVVERYIDPGFRFSGLGSLVRYALGGRSVAMESGRFDVNEIARSFPETAETMLLDKYLSDEPGASARVFRVYRPTPAHYHVHCDEHLYVLSGRGVMWIGDASKAEEFGPGIFLVFKRGTVHAMPEILEGPVVFLSVDMPRRQPTDIVFVDPGTGTPQTFIKGY